MLNGGDEKWSEETVPILTEFEIFDYDSSETEVFYLAEMQDGDVLKISDTVRLILQTIDGTSTLKEIRCKLETNLGHELEMETLQEVLEYLSNQGLVMYGSNKLSQESPDDELQKNRSRGPGGRRGFTISIPFMNERVCSVVGRCFSPLFSKYVMFVLVIISLLVNINSLFIQNMSFPEWSGQYTLVFIFISVLAHEFGHIAASVRNGVTPKEAGMGFFLFFPVFYVDLNRAWRLKRRQRVQIDIGGVYMQLVFSTLVIFVNGFIFPQINPWLISFLTFNMILLNMMPFFRWDGYWLISDLIGINNLNSRASGFFTNRFSKGDSKIQNDWDFGLNPTQRVLIPLFGLSTIVYGIIVFGFAISMFSVSLASGELIIRFGLIVHYFITLDIIAAFLETFILLPFLLVPLYIVMIIFILVKTIVGILKKY